MFGHLVRIPTRLFQSNIYSTSPLWIYVVDHEAIKQITKILVNDDLETPIFELNPGPGYLTEALLKAGVKKVRSFSIQTNSLYDEKLTELKKKYPDQLETYTDNIGDYRRLHEDEIASRDLTKPIEDLPFFADIKERKWSDPPTIKMFAPLTLMSESRFIGALSSQIIHRTGIFSKGRVEFHLIISGSSIGRLTDVAPKYRRQGPRKLSVLMATFLDVEVATKLRWSSFFPEIVVPKKKKYIQSDLNNAYYVKFAPKANLESILHPKLWPDYAFFLKQLSFKRRNHVIPYVERWLPDCGPRLIKKGIPLFREFPELTTQEIFQLFHEISSWPEYNSSIFKAASNSLTDSRVYGENDDELSDECLDEKPRRIEN